MSAYREPVNIAVFTLSAYREPRVRVLKYIIQIIMEDGKETLSNVNKPFDFEMKKENMENEENKNIEQGESFSELDDSNLSVGGEEVDAVEVEEQKLAAVVEVGKDGEESVTEKFDVARSKLEVDAVVEFDMSGEDKSVFERVGTPVLMAEEVVAEETQVLESDMGGIKSVGKSGDSHLTYVTT
ncbi:zinc finger CCCH domain-containing protein 19-like [Forsythia ovata]|uniref:Zinc finger CCCH domain-containing protein 19-like n=1 Tax=Forsythia ovata TaxID=205694 RepID=A0ABD1SLD8_9LAMI